MNAYVLESVATAENFVEEDYLRANPDVAFALQEGRIRSGREHFETFGHTENRRMRLPYSALVEAKRKKIEKLIPLFRSDLISKETTTSYDFLTQELRARFNIVDTDAVSSNDYDPDVMRLVEQYADGLVLDCGAGKRAIYFDNVVNFEIADYDTTDVRGVGEMLPFIDGAFDAVISVAVLEHVKDPFLCAREIARVLKPGGRLVCCVPFLQPLHGYPHHYYNMSGQGLQNLFADFLAIDQLAVLDSVLPVWSLTWMLQSWVSGLAGKTQEDFLQMRIADLMRTADHYLDQPFVRELSDQKNLELASATVLFAHK